MEDTVEMLALVLREKDIPQWIFGVFLLPFTFMFRFRDKAQENQYPDRNRPLHATVWVENLKLVRSLLGQ
jgi:fatty acid desaturase